MKEPARDASSDDQSLDKAKLGSFRQKTRLEILNERLLLDQKKQDESQKMNPKSKSTKKKIKFAAKKNRLTSVPSDSKRLNFSSNASRDQLENKNTIASSINNLQVEVKSNPQTSTVTTKTSFAIENTSTTAATNKGPSVGDSGTKKVSRKKKVKLSRKKPHKEETIQKATTGEYLY